MEGLEYGAITGFITGFTLGMIFRSLFSVCPSDVNCKRDKDSVGDIYLASAAIGAIVAVPFAGLGAFFGYSGGSVLKIKYDFPVSKK